MRRSQLVVLSVFVLSLALTAPAGAAELTSPPARDRAPAGDWRVVDSEIARVAESERPLEVAERIALPARDGRVQVVVVAENGAADGIAAWLAARDGREVKVVRGRVQAFVPPALLAGLDRLDGVAWVRAPIVIEPPGPVPDRAPRLKAGAVDSEGLEGLNAPEWHADGFTGEGMKVGVIDVEFGGWMDLLGTELPPADRVEFQQHGGIISQNRVHGTACAEIVHDIVPDADLWLGLVSTATDIAQAIDWMTDEGVDVITMSLGFSEGPGDGTGIQTDAIRDYVAGGQGVFATSAGNERTSHWQGRLMDADGDGWVELNDAGDELLPISPSLPSGERIRVSLMWSDWTVVDQDLSLHLFRTGGDEPEQVRESDFTQSGSPAQQPLERTVWTADQQSTLAVGVFINNVTRPLDLEMFVGDYNFVGHVPEGSLTTPADTLEAMAVAAVRHSSFTLESFSSAGPTNGPGGTIDGGSLKPDIAGYDGVSTVSYGTLGFFGTSAASPHVAGAAALVWSANPGWTGDQVRAFLEAQAIDRSPGGVDNDTGWGRVNLGPSPMSGCSYQLSETSDSLGAGRGIGTVTVTTGQDCFWSASSRVPWIQIAPDSRTGSGNIAYIVEANASPAQREGTIDIAGQTFTVQQEAAAACGFVLDPADAEFSAAGGDGSFQVLTDAGCTWTATTAAPWIELLGAVSGTGAGEVSYRVETNATDVDRLATVVVAGEAHTVTQRSPQYGRERSLVGGIADAAGAGSTRWKSNLAALNRSGETAELELTYRHSGGTEMRGVTLDTGAQVEWDNVAANLFGVAAGSSGIVEVASETPVVVTARTFNDAASGTFGQFLPGVGTDAALAQGETGILAPIASNAGFRTNVGLVNVGSDAAVAEVRIVGADGAERGSPVEISAGPGQWVQENRVLRTAGAQPCEACYARVTLTSGEAAWAYGSVVDNGSGDPTTLSVVRSAVAKEAGDLLRVAGVADTAGANQTRWKSQLAVVSLSDAPTALTLIYRHDGGAESRQVQLMAGAMASWDNVAVDLFGIASSAGAVEISADSPVVVTARTFNNAPSGTFGQALPGVASGEGIAVGRAGVLPQLRSDDDFRTNVGFVNLTAGACTATVRLYAGSGDQVGSALGMNVPAGGWTQTNRVFRAANAGDCLSCYAVVETAVAGCELWAYGSVVDNGSGDPTTVPVVIEQ